MANVPVLVWRVLGIHAQKNIYIHFNFSVNALLPIKEGKILYNDTSKDRFIILKIFGSAGTDLKREE